MQTDGERIYVGDRADAGRQLHPWRRTGSAWCFERGRNAAWRAVRSYPAPAGAPGGFGIACTKSECGLVVGSWVQKATRVDDGGRAYLWGDPRQADCLRQVQISAGPGPWSRSRAVHAPQPFAPPQTMGVHTVDHDLLDRHLARQWPWARGLTFGIRTVTCDTSAHGTYLIQR